MMKMTIMSLSNALNINFIKLNHPMSMMMFIIIQTLLIGLTAGTLMESFWLAYILFLTFLGGMLVLFIYITSIASNEMFQLKSISVILTGIMWLILTISLILLDKSLYIDLLKNSDTYLTTNNMNFQEMTMSLNKIYNNPTFMITMMMMIYLFLALLAVVKITNINQGPIRKMS
uniref:NADH-ubiquinone oxidoreductase chain 6 n=2 Tax=Prionotropisinae TaxID=323402 RepID=L7PBC9_9ORTH|nr:NADH dehydrogenase subunit 6 [Filchnerella helanshanensis]YP_007474983.1 NADH dehydrogenase subunit 6 [Pseudotmethis rubimarginis]AFR34281.1 NADH dehydrogenase subunit 6 [Filchnerella helanshanensis]AFR34294.1 NADH dehydrogenase subunit 6 [Pseudotmethis rubimarginis]